jgi:hypothetical protein
MPRHKGELSKPLLWTCEFSKGISIRNEGIKKLRRNLLDFDVSEEERQLVRTRNIRIARALALAFP